VVNHRVNNIVNDWVNEMVNHMSKGKHKPPSRIKYETSHPVISVRISKELHGELKELAEATGKSFADFLKDGAGITKTQIEESPPPECTLCQETQTWGNCVVLCKDCFTYYGEELPGLLEIFFSS